MDVINRIKELTKQKGWSEYRLAKESDLSGSTIANIFHRNTVPSVYTLECLCKAFGITLSQFFVEDEADMISPSKDQREILIEWEYLNVEQRERLILFLKSIRNNNTPNK